MLDPIIHGLSNEQYHYGEEERQYLSSSQLKLYKTSPKAYKYAIEHPDEHKSDALRVGSLFHDLMASFVERDGTWDGYRVWRSKIAVFTPPINEKTGQPYGSATKAYKEAYDAFLQANADKTIASAEELDLMHLMVQSLLDESGATSKQVRKLLKWGKPEVSHFVEYQGCKFKFRPDLETNHKIVDWKTINTDDLSERSINSVISKYGYDISAAFYMFMEHHQSGVWKPFYWVFVSKTAPYDAVMVDASKWTYDLSDGIAMPQVGAIKMKALLDLHLKCTRENKWPGAEMYIPQSGQGHRIMCPQPPTWEFATAADLLETSLINETI